MSKSPSPLVPPAPPNPSETKYEKDFLESYGKYSATLRQWLGGYAAGMFAFLALNDPRWKALIASGQIRYLGWLLLVGIALQLLPVFLYKTSNSVGWVVATGQKERKGFVYWVSTTITGSIRFDVITDLISILTFLVATFIIFNIVNG
jgi:hypothetical protein